MSKIKVKEIISSVPLKDYLPSLELKEIKSFLNLILKTNVPKGQLSNSLARYLVSQGVIESGTIENSSSWNLTEMAKHEQIYQHDVIHDLHDIVYQRNEAEVKARMKKERMGVTI